MNHKELERWYRLKTIRKASLILVSLVVVASLSGYAASRFFAGPHETMEMPTPTQDSAMRIQNFSYSSPGARSWELRAASALISQSADYIDLSGPRIAYHGGRGGEINVSAETGVFDRNTRKVTARGNVKLEYGNLVFTTQELDYFDDRKIAHTSSDVHLQGKDLLVAGKNLTVFLDAEEVVIEDDVKAEIRSFRLVASNGNNDS